MAFLPPRWGKMRGKRVPQTYGPPSKRHDLFPLAFVSRQPAPLGHYIFSVIESLSLLTDSGRSLSSDFFPFPFHPGNLLSANHSPQKRKIFAHQIRGYLQVE
ncbi:hypothetical protein SAY87_017655 [Trapa incisa]|uniref:Uncharacterized protein n=1 Tax=Trapa incisa TaxID=236973 RepID=A0AAN7QWA0_9MYRT|nr:hypothetical protein SAY87_017655 [Trapa incisa]